MRSFQLFFVSLSISDLTSTEGVGQDLRWKIRNGAQKSYQIPQGQQKAWMKNYLDTVDG